MLENVFISNGNFLIAMEIKTYLMISDSLCMFSVDETVTII